MKKLYVLIVVLTLVVGAIFITDSGSGLGTGCGPTFEQHYTRHAGHILFAYASDYNGIYPLSLTPIIQEAQDEKLKKFLLDPRLSYHRPSAHEAPDYYLLVFHDISHDYIYTLGGRSFTTKRQEKRTMPSSESSETLDR